MTIAARIWRHSGRIGIGCSDHYEEKGVFQRLMDRLRRITPRDAMFVPVMNPGSTAATTIVGGLKKLKDFVHRQRRPMLSP
jgi:hypothetical protein